MKKLLLIVIIMSSIAIKAQVTTLSLKLYLEGLYIPNSSSSSNPTGLMNPAQDYVNGNPINNWGPEYADIITVELRDNSCNVIFSSYEKLFTDGTCNVTVPDYQTSYFIFVKNRNHLWVFSSNSVFIGNNPMCDFSQPNNMAYYSDAQIQVGVDINNNPVYALYSGDIDQSGWVDSSDWNIWDNTQNYCGYSYSADIDGDGCVGSSDESIFSTWVTSGQTTQCPCNNNCP